MDKKGFGRRAFLKHGAAGVPLGVLAAVDGGKSAEAAESGTRGSQRLSVEQLRAWESLGYGMFIHFGMSTFVGDELPDGICAGPSGR